jgi:tryptophan 2,3-dioxygenase
MNNNAIIMMKIKENPFNLMYVDEQTDEMCLAAVEQDGRALEYVKNQTYEICLAAVKEDYEVLSIVKNQTPELCMAAVQHDGFAITKMKKKMMTLPIFIAALKQNSRVVEFYKKGWLIKAPKGFDMSMI